MANRIFQNVVVQMKNAIERTVGVVDLNGTIIACSDITLQDYGNFVDFKKIKEGVPTVIDGKTFFTVEGQYRCDNAVFVDGNDETAKRFAKLIAVSVGSLKRFYDEKHDKSNFVKNVITNNILPGDIYLKARELGISNEVSRCVLVIRTNEKSDVAINEAVGKLFPDKNKDIVITTGELDTTLVKEVKSDTEMLDLENLARSIVDTLTSDYFISCHVGIGSIVTGVRDLPLSFKNARIALEVGKVFDTDKTIVTYESLGIARLIYQLPTVICESFLHEIFKRGSISGLDRETYFTIQKFFENNLNVSETSRKLFVHRNTLVYRLEKIKKLTGLDLREFDDAIVFKVALMVKRYLEAKPTKF